MRFAEVALRIGTGLVAWMIVFAYFLWIAIAGRVGCDADRESLFALLLAAAPAAVIGTVLIGATRPLPEVHRIVRWLGAGPALLLPFVAYSLMLVWGSIDAVSGYSCDAGPAPIWQAYWFPVQVAAVLACAILIYRNWKI